MQHTASEHATKQFYAWETKGRGFQVAPTPVDLEANFVPFFSHHPPDMYVDDGIRHTVLSAIADFFTRKEPEPVPVASTELPYVPYNAPQALCFIRFGFPREYKISGSDMEQVLLLLSYCTKNVSFEIIATEDQVRFQLACAKEEAGYVIHTFASLFPALSITDDPTDAIACDEYAIIGIQDYGLQQEFMRPCTMHRDTHEPFTILLPVLEYLRTGELVVLQVLFCGVVNTWQESMLNAVTDNHGGPFFYDAPEMLPATKEKIAAPLFAATIRVLVQAPEEPRVHALITQMAHAIGVISRSPVNSLTPLPSYAYTFEQRYTDVVFRESHRLGMLLNSKELLTFVHCPSAHFSAIKLHRGTKTTKAVSPAAVGSSVVLGTNTHRGQTISVRMREEDRFKHTHIIGSTGTGKSTLLLRMILQDIASGKGIAVFDPHGDLIEQALLHMPAHRAKDCIVIDPAQSEYPIGLNLLHSHDQEEQDILAADMVSVFRRLSTSWGDQMNSVLHNALLAFFYNTRTGTLLNLRRFLIEKHFRESWFATITDPSIRYYWTHEYPLLKTSSVGPILTRLDTFLRPRQVRLMVAQEKMLAMKTVVEKQQILLVKLSKGLIGADNSYLLGSLLIAKLHQVILGQQGKAMQERIPYFLYVDEFQNFVTPSMAEILSGVRKYKLGLILAHQDIGQLQRSDSELLNAVLSNCYTRICFRLGDSDAKKLQEGFASFSSADFQNLDIGEALVRIGKPEHDFNLATDPMLPQEPNEAMILQILRYSERHGTPREDVEAYIAHALGHTEHIEKTSSPKAESMPSDSTFEVPTHPTNMPDAVEHQALIEDKAAKHERSQHRYYQTFIKKMAESYGYRAKVEHALSKSSGKVDIHLEKEDRTIAVEICMTTPASWELHNIEKCIQEGYTEILSFSRDTKAALQLRQRMQSSLSPEHWDKVSFLDPESLLGYFIEPATQPTVTVMKGYRIRVEHAATSEEHAVTKTSVIKILQKAQRKKKT